MTDTDGKILTLEEIAAYLKAGKRTIYRLAGHYGEDVQRHHRGCRTA